MHDLPDGRDIAEALGLDFDGLKLGSEAKREPRKLLNILLVLPGSCVPKKNNAQTVQFTRKNGSTGFTRIPSHAYTMWLNRAATALGAYGHATPIDEPVNVRIHFYLNHARKTDLSNLLEGPADLLVAAEVLADDNYKILAGFDGSRVFIDRENPRTEILITPLDQERRD